MCVSGRVTPLCHCRLKPSSLNQSSAPEYSSWSWRAETESHTQAVGEDSVRHRQSELTGLTLRRRAKTGIKESGSKERQRERITGEPKKKITRYFRSRASETLCQSSDVFICIYLHPPLWEEENIAPWQQARSERNNKQSEWSLLLLSS